MMAAYALHIPSTSLGRAIPCLWLGCALLHSAACTINDIFDREMDRLVGKLNIYLSNRLHYTLIQLQISAHSKPTYCTGCYLCAKCLGFLSGASGGIFGAFIMGAAVMVSNTSTATPGSTKRCDYA
jgi:4-hydroxybenzoate polyprenyltransferase